MRLGGTCASILHRPKYVSILQLHNGTACLFLIDMAAFEQVHESYLQRAPAVVRIHAQDYCDVTAQNGEFQRRIYWKRAIFRPMKARRQLSTFICVVSSESLQHIKFHPNMSVAL